MAEDGEKLTQREQEHLAGCLGYAAVVDGQPLTYEQWQGYEPSEPEPPTELERRALADEQRKQERHWFNEIHRAAAILNEVSDAMKGSPTDYTEIGRNLLDARFHLCLGTSSLVLDYICKD